MQQLRQLLQQFIALRMRERVLAVIALLGVVYFVFDVALIRPQQKAARALREQIEQQNSDIVAFTQARQAFMAQARVDPLARQRAELQDLRSTFAQAESLIQQASGDGRVGEILRGMVSERSGVTLASVKTLPVETLLKAGGAAAASSAASASAAAAMPMPALYKHGVEIVVQGSYPALVQYLQSAEQSARGIFWGNVKLDVVGYPNATMKVTVYTLSSSPGSPLG